MKKAKENEKKELLSLQNWRSTPSTNNRVATIEDVENGSAVFVVENVSSINIKPYKIELPKLAYWNDIEHGQRELVVIIQVEETPEGIITGYKDFEGKYGAGFFYEFEILSEEQIKTLQ
ncbi:hypothetical protein D1J36_001505 [Riemerella anatipestifer]|uniref:hypothetical protein n=1 Tax=Riemerella anatipestifer TaxID=34085 RepID=UPI0012AD28D6|nr:hypothetical protein [Riemerella anatipestifer]MDY3521715.1 hypothetical protein [Riemerella anatipestifer]MDY3533982.1 hypothetical protein [Riemerella anatipestifer]MDY3536196.1 hypothetical protein [Riemerella anatipestifer]USL95812.1 hypothetical protein D1J36_001505 [Riemerella anatipestifer]